MKKYIGVALYSMFALLLACKDPDVGFSPGPGDSRLVGTWQIVERHYPKDSSKTVLTIIPSTRRDTISVTIGGQVVDKDTLLTVYDTTYVRQDTSFYVTKRYTLRPAQTLTFSGDGRLRTNGDEMTYYTAYKFYSVDKTYADSLLMDLIIRTNGATYRLEQGVEFRQDTLIINHRCDQPCSSKFLRSP